MRGERTVIGRIRVAKAGLGNGCGSQLGPRRDGATGTGCEGVFAGGLICGHRHAGRAHCGHSSSAFRSPAGCRAAMFDHG